MMREMLGRAFGAFLVLAGLALVVLGIWFAWQDRRWSYLGGSVLGAVFFLHGLSRLFPGQPPPLPIETGDPIMAAAMDRARREFRRFASGLAEGKREALVKYAMKTGYGENEHVWAIAHAIDGDEVVTSLASEPVGTDADVGPERKRIRVAEIEDWLLLDADGRMEGGFTQIAMAKIYKRDKGYVPYAIRKGLPEFVDLDDQDLL